MTKGLEIAPALQALEQSGTLKPTSLNLPADISYEQYAQLGVLLTLLYKANRWWLVDWLIFGEGVFSDRVDQAVAATGLSERRVKNLRLIGEAVPPSRRMIELSVDWHAEVVSLTPKEQRRWLSRAKREKDTNPAFTQREFRDLIREEYVARGEPLPARKTRSTPAPVIEAGSNGMSDIYTVKAALCRRLVHEAVGTGDAYVRVPRELINQLAIIIGESPI